MGTDVSKVNTYAAVHLFPVLPSLFHLDNGKVEDRKARTANFLPIFVFPLFYVRELSIFSSAYSCLE